MAEPTIPATTSTWAATGTKTEPSGAYKDAGWTPSTKPPAAYFNWWMNNVFTWLVWLTAKLSLFVGYAPDTTLTIATGSITATQGNHAIDTEAAAASDDLTNIVTTNLDDGRMLVIRAVNAARVVTVKHAAGGAGQIHLIGGVDVLLNSTGRMLNLKRVGADWYELYNSATSPHGLTFITATGAGNFIVPDGVNTIDVEIQGAGGGGGGTDFTLTTNKGGGGGAYKRQTFTGLTAGASLAYTVGTGGAGGASGANAGANGTVSTFNGSSANFGTGGGLTIGVGGLAPVWTGFIQGHDGSDGLLTAGGKTFLSPYNGPAVPGNGAAGTLGTGGEAGQFDGSPHAGGNGGNGVIVIHW